MTDENQDLLVSVVVPTYNRAEMIGDALESIYHQDYRPIEVVVVDDGSTDDTEKTVAAWKDRHCQDSFDLRYLRQKNQGGNPARNYGISVAKGDFVAFLDSDDEWLSEKLSEQISVFKANPNTGAVYCGVRHINAATGEITEPAGRQYPSGKIFDQIIIRDVTSPTSAYMIRREVFERVGDFDVTLQARQDWDMWIRIASKYRIDCVPKALVNYREHPGERTASDPTKEMKAYSRIMEKYQDLREAQSWTVRRAAESAYYKRMGRVSFHQRISWLKAVGYLSKALITWPFDFDTWAALLGVIIPRGVRGVLHRLWNRFFGKTPLAIRSH